MLSFLSFCLFFFKKLFWASSIYILNRVVAYVIYVSPMCIVSACTFALYGMDL